MPNKYILKGNRFQWSMEDIERAATAVRNGDMSTRQAAKTYGVPRSTLQRHLSDNCNTGQKGTLKSVFTLDEENRLANHIIKVQQTMYGLTPECIRKMAYRFAEMNNIPNRFSKESSMAGKDYSAFMKRHPNLSLRTPESSSLSRLTGFNRVQVNFFFQHLANAYDMNQYSPERIVNMDESGLSTVQTKTQKILAQKGSKQVGIRPIASAEKGETTTVLCAFNAAGLYIPPAFIFKQKQLNAQLMEQAPVGSVGFTSDSGWITEDIFVRWLSL